MIADLFDPALCDPLILGANNSEEGPDILIDGNHRATALTLRRLRNPDASRVNLTFFLAVSGQPIRVWPNSHDMSRK